MEALIEGRADIGVMYTPQARPGLTVELLLEERLVMVSTRPQPSVELQADYIYVDWGPEFFAQHSLAFPSFVGAALTVNIGWLGLQQILAAGGSGYFPLRMLHEHELAGRLHRVDAAPEFRLPGVSLLPCENGFRAAVACLGHDSASGSGSAMRRRSATVERRVPGG